MSENTESDDKKSFWGSVGRKPLQIQRILTENGQMRLKSKSECKVSPNSPSPLDKENTRALEVSSCTNITEDSTVEQEWFTDAMSSTMAVSSNSTPDRLKPGLFSISSNLSSINFSSGPNFSSTSDVSLADKIFKTPKRQPLDEAADVPGHNSVPVQHSSSPSNSPSSGCSVKTPGVPNTPRTPSSSSWVSARTPTSSGGSKTPISNGHSRTPSSTASNRTPFSTCGTRTPSSGSGTPSARSSGSCGRSVRTPSSSSSSTRWNPFDSQNSADMLHPTLSPNVFSTVISPSQENDSSSGRFWSIDQQAEMFPTTISDDSPLKQSIYVKNYSKDMESKTQEQIELYFKEHHVITSPPDLPPTGPLLVDSPDLSYSQVEKKVNSTWSQTVLTFPPILPPQVEQILKQYCTFQDPVFTSSTQEEANNLSNSTLRRKLFNADMCSDSSRSPSPESSPPSPSSPLSLLTPGRVIHTPLTSKNPGQTSAQWSSSPVKGCGARTTSFSPPDHMGSPMFSPIVKDKMGNSRNNISRQFSQDTVDSSVGDSEDMQGITSSQNNSVEVVGRANCSRDLTAELSLPPSQDITGELYQTAEIDTADSADTSVVVSMDVDSNSGAGWVVGQTPGTISHSNTGETSKSRTGEGWGASTISGEGWAVSLPDDTEGGSRVDTGYMTQNTASITNLTPSSPTNPSLSRQDSGVGQQETTCGVSVLAPQLPPPNSNNVLMSYHAADNTNDISVGFPLGSSTPTKK